MSLAHLCTDAFSRCANYLPCELVHEDGLAELVVILLGEVVGDRSVRPAGFASARRRFHLDGPHERDTAEVKDM
jgi:hypothetical protein